MNFCLQYSLFITLLVTENQISKGQKNIKEKDLKALGIVKIISLNVDKTEKYWFDLTETTLVN